MLEKAAGQQAGLGWIGKNTLLPTARPAAGSSRRAIRRHRAAGRRAGDPRSLRQLPRLPGHLPHRGVRRRTAAGRAALHFLPHHRASRPIPVELRDKIGNRVFGCDDCQIVCPGTASHAPPSRTTFSRAIAPDNAELATLFRWTEEEFLSRTEGSPLRRAGYERWLRNLAVGRAMRRRASRCWKRFRRAATIRRSWCASM